MRSLRHFAVPAVLGMSLLTAQGCASDHRNDIPATASLQAEAKGTNMFTAPQSGRVYVYNASKDKIVYAGDVRRGEAVQVDAEDDELVIGGRRVLETDIDNDDRHQIFFEPVAEAIHLHIDEARPASDNVRVNVHRDGDVQVKTGETDSNVEIRTDSEPDRKVIIKEEDRDPDVIIKEEKTTIRHE